MDQRRSGYISLARQQLDCLAGASLDLSSAEIGTILGIPATAVDETIELACGRLGVQTRAEAVFIVLHTGLAHTSIVHLMQEADGLNRIRRAAS
jgi:DNA-binding CsgD family transcriptional regulator